MEKCEYCGKDLIFYKKTCDYCGDSLCFKCRTQEKHNCFNLRHPELQLVKTSEDMEKFTKSLKKGKVRVFRD